VHTVLNRTPWPVTEKDCVIAQLIATAAKESSRLGHAVPFSCVYTHTAITLRPIGNGSFAKHMLGLVAQRDKNKTKQQFRVLPPYSPSSLLDYQVDVLSDKSVQAVYVCSPDHLHHTQAIECLTAGKHVLVEKPVYNFNDLMTTYDNILSDLKTKTTSGDANTRAPVFMIGFHRRFAAEFIRAKEACRATKPRSIVIESRDPVPADKDLSFVLRNSVCHDVDLVHWLLDGGDSCGNVDGGGVSRSVSINFSTCTSDANTSLIILKGIVIIQHTNNSTEEVQLSIIYSKEHKTYLQKCVIDGILFGYDYQPEEGASNPYLVYQAAYKAQWNHFAGLIQDKDCQETGQEERGRWEGYKNTFTSLDKAEELLRRSIS
jgi:predicted dehydrogenase